MAKIFFSYSHDDETYRDQLEKHLAPLRHEGLIESWHDRRLLAGSDLVSSIDHHINQADVILLLVSASFLSSHYCYSIEMTRALERRDNNEVDVVPIIVRPCDWTPTVLGSLLAAPRDGKPITSWPNFDEAYTDIAKQIRSVVKARASRTAQLAAPASVAGGRPSPSVATTVASAVPAGTAPRSSNLRLNKTFTELDKDKFLHETLAYISRYFENSLQELQTRNAGIEARYRTIDTYTFAASIYRDGRRMSECAVGLGRGGFRTSNTISYSNDASSRGSSFNEQVSVGCDDQAMFLVPLGLGSFGNTPKKLSQEGAAELFWSMLIERLQQ